MSSQINQLSQQTQKLARAELEAIEYSSIAELREKTLEILNKYTNASVEMASAYGANFFQSAMAENGEETSAAMYSFSNDDANERAVRGMLQDVATGGSVSAFFDKVQNRLDYNIRKASNESVLENVKDRSKHLKFARVPVGRETCVFCFMLASRGFVYWSKATAGLYDHYHSNCDCRIVPGYDDMNPDGQIGGYEPTKLARQYEDCYNAVKSPDGGFDYDHFKKDVAKGKYEDTSKDWERWKLNRLMKEMKSRDTDWLWEKKIPATDYSLNAKENYGKLKKAGNYDRENIINRGNEWRDLWVHHVLEEKGFNVQTQDGESLDLKINGRYWEVKSPDIGTADNLRFIEGNLRKAKKQFLKRGYGETRVILNLKYKDVSVEEAYPTIKRWMSELDIDELKIIDGEGRLFSL